MDTITVSFPKMNLDLHLSRVAFEVFGIPIYWYGIIIAAAFFVCVLLAMKDTRKFDLVPDTIVDLMLFAAPISIICARLYFVIFSWDNYKSDFREIFNIRNGGLAIYGGIIGAIITAYFVAKYKKIPTFKLFDFAIPYVALGQAIGRWGNFFNQEAFGTNTSLPWGMTSPTIKSYLATNAQHLQEVNGITVNPDLPVHPTFLYESLWNIAVFAFLIWLRKKKKFEGEVFCFYFITYSIGRAFIEGLRTDSLMLGNLRVSQLLSIILVIAFGVFVIYKRNKIKNTQTNAFEIGHSDYAQILKIMEENTLEEENKKANAAEEVKKDSIKDESADELHLEDLKDKSEPDNTKDSSGEEGV